MSRQIFFMFAAFVAISVGLFAMLFPVILLETKGVAALPTTLVWTMETGLLILATGIMIFLVRKEKSSPTLKAIVLGNIIIQLGLFTLELTAFLNGVITKPSGVIPNLTVHVLLATGFFYFWRVMKVFGGSEEI